LKGHFRHHTVWPNIGQTDPEGVLPMVFPQLSRRRLLAGAGIALTSYVLPRRLYAAPPAAEITPDGFRVLRARAGSVSLRSPKETSTPIWGYDGMVPGPTLRVKRGEGVKVRLVNELTRETVVHWHGLRLPNAMDGVPHLTQAPVRARQELRLSLHGARCRHFLVSQPRAVL
jgi:FtsP/CotA-like multicopper oxidase with cupredoxin domain